MSRVLSSSYRHPRLGTVKVTARARSRRMSASWVGPEVHVNIPSGMPVDDYERILEGWVPELLRVRPAINSLVGTVVEAPGLRVEIVAGRPRRGNAEIIALESDICAYRIVVADGIAAAGDSDVARSLINARLLALALSLIHISEPTRL